MMTYVFTQNKPSKPALYTLHFSFISTRNPGLDLKWSTLDQKWSNSKFWFIYGPTLKCMKELIFGKYFFRIFHNLLKQNFGHKILKRNLKKKYFKVGPLLVQPSFSSTVHRSSVFPCEGRRNRHLESNFGNEV